MSSFDLDRQRQQQRSRGTMQPNQQTGGQQTQALPPTGLEQQLAKLNQGYAQVAGARKIGFDVRGAQMQQAQGMEGQGAMQNQMGGSTSLDQMARSLAQSYGLAIGRGRLVDEHGNFLGNAEQLAAASGGTETLGSAAIKLQYISQAVTQKQREMEQQKGIATMQTGLGQVQSRGRGSLAGMQSGMYQNLANMYMEKAQDYESMDFSFWVQKEEQQIAAQLMRRQEKLAKRQGYMQMAVGAAQIASGNYAGGAVNIYGGGTGAGWW